jgi:hypothetical protein
MSYQEVRWLNPVRFGYVMALLYGEPMPQEGCALYYIIDKMEMPHIQDVSAIMPTHVAGI